MAQLVSLTQGLDSTIFLLPGSSRKNQALPANRLKEGDFAGVFPGCNRTPRGLIMGSAIPWSAKLEECYSGWSRISGFMGDFGGAVWNPLKKVGDKTGAANHLGSTNATELHGLSCGGLVAFSPERFL